MTASKHPSRWLQRVFFAVVVRPIVLFLMGLNIRRRELLPDDGPAIVVANHNSHLDTVVLMTLFPGKLLRIVRPAAAADYFLKNPLLAWFSNHIMAILPVTRGGGGKGRPLEHVEAAIKNGEIVILFPEGSRGNPEERQTFKKGIAYLAKDFPDVPIVPVFMHGLGKALPKGEALFVPFFCDVFVGEALRYGGDIDGFMQGLEETMSALAAEGEFPSWD